MSPQWGQKFLNRWYLSSSSSSLCFLVWILLSCSGSSLSTQQPGSAGNIEPHHPRRGRHWRVNISTLDLLTGSCFRGPYRNPDELRATCPKQYLHQWISLRFLVQLSHCFTHVPPAPRTFPSKCTASKSLFQNEFLKNKTSLSIISFSLHSGGLWRFIGILYHFSWQCGKEQRQGPTIHWVAEPKVNTDLCNSQAHIQKPNTREPGCDNI